MKCRSAYALAVASLAALPAAGQDRAGPEQNVVVTGELHRDAAVRSFVEEVTVETGDQIARFAVPVCPASFGLPAGHNETIAARLRQIADHLGLGSGGAGCRPNVVLIFADNGGDFVQRLRRERPDLFMDLELPDVRTVLRAPGPVRAWQAIEPRGADGRAMEAISFLEVNGKLQYIGRARHLAGVMPSLIQRATRQDLAISFVVFDLDSVEGLTLLQIADYAAMRTLARTDAAAAPARRSILGLFDARDTAAAPAGELTDWDAAYLRALYRTGRTLTGRQQRSDIARTMRRDLETSQSQAGAPEQPRP